VRRSQRIAKRYIHKVANSAEGTCQERAEYLAYLNAIQATCDESLIDSKGSDPSAFMPEPKRLFDLFKLPIQVQKAWCRALVQEFRGLVKENTFSPETPPPDFVINQIMEIFKCKLDMYGMLDKLKSRIVFRGDLYTPSCDMDSWNPHASWLSLKIFLAMCAYFGIFPSQLDFVMAYIQVAMKERVYIKFPSIILNFSQWNFTSTSMFHFD
jgi:hypothetical protein